MKTLGNCCTCPGEVPAVKRILLEGEYKAFCGSCYAYWKRLVERANYQRDFSSLGWWKAAQNREKVRGKPIKLVDLEANIGRRRPRRLRFKNKLR